MDKSKEFDADVFKEVVKILREEREKAYLHQLKSLNKAKKGIKRNGRTKALR